MKIPRSFGFLLNIIIFCLVGVLVSRGVLQMILPKSVAMIGQLGCVMTVLTGLFLCYIRYFSQRFLLLFVLSLAFLIVIGCSAFLTSLLQDFHYWLIYLLFNICLIWIALGVVRLQDTAIPAISFHKIALFWGWALFIVACAEQLKLITTPGYSFVGPLIRSASLTGSFLHYPIIIALLAYVVLQWFVITKSKLYLVSGLLFAFAPVMVASRSGVFIIGFTTFILWVMSLLRGERTAIWLTALIVLIIGVAIGASLQQDNSLVERLAERFLKATHSQSAGNAGRIQAWVEASDLWLSSNLLFGEHTGTITNSTQNVIQGQSEVAESSILQQLVNFGLLGLLIFYGILVHIFTYIRREHRLLRYVYLAALAQTFFYQSIEVVPFITLLLFMPWISQSLWSRPCQSLTG